MPHEAPAYGLWAVVVLNLAVFIVFAFSFGKPQTPRDWRSFSAFSAFIAIMFGFPLQWPTLLTLLMFPVLGTMYVHLAHVEEAEARLTFGASYDRYAAAVPAWFARPLPASGGRHGLPHKS
jgi:protein-S-isoprenylcysteine O-methyltransferase Ste14